jgi:hypothetical protein
MRHIYVIDLNTGHIDDWYDIGSVSDEECAALTLKLLLQSSYPLDVIDTLDWDYEQP